MDKKRELNKGLKERHIQLIALGGIISSAYFLGNGYVLSIAGPAAVLGYIVAGIVVYIVMICLGELTVHRPATGSFVDYAREYISPTWAIGVGWSYWINWSVFIPSEMIAAGIIANSQLPFFSSVEWAIVFALILSIINILNVKLFGEVEFWLALLKIIAIISFSILAMLLIFDILPNRPQVRFDNIFKSGGFFPNGIWAVLLSMVIILVNFQGTEIIGLAAGESKNPEVTIPKAIRHVSYRIILLFVVPLFLLICLYPYNSASLSSSVFLDALEYYKLHWFSRFFTIIVLSAALSSANSGLYASGRCMYALANDNIAPKCFGKLNKNCVPQNAILLSLLTCWFFIILYTFIEETSFYSCLLALSGFTGEIAWISICWSHISFRKEWYRSGKTSKDLKYKVPLFPYLAHFAIWFQVVALFVMIFSPDLRKAFYFGIPMLLVPMLIYKINEIIKNRQLQK
jgi:amino acid transporter, AAT family